MDNASRKSRNRIRIARYLAAPLGALSGLGCQSVVISRTDTEATATEVVQRVVAQGVPAEVEHTVGSAFDVRVSPRHVLRAVEALYPTGTGRGECAQPTAKSLFPSPAQERAMRQREIECSLAAELGRLPGVTEALVKIERKGPTAWDHNQAPPLVSVLLTADNTVSIAPLYAYVRAASGVGARGLVEITTIAPRAPRHPLPPTKHVQLLPGIQVDRAHLPAARLVLTGLLLLNVMLALLLTLTWRRLQQLRTTNP